METPSSGFWASEAIRSFRAAWFRQKLNNPLTTGNSRPVKIFSLGRYFPTTLTARGLARPDSQHLGAQGQDPVRPPLSGAVAIIGTREPTKHGEIIATRITEFFVENNWGVVSGLAVGCDAIAHQTALSNGGHTVAVLAHGLQTVAPKQHQRLADEILMQGGALVSEYQFGQGVIPQQFVKRDRTQAGLAQGVVMIQSDLKGGSLHASRATVSYGRWLAVPYPTKDDCGRNEPRIQANLLLSNGSEEEKATLLKCGESGLSLMHVLRGKEDYSQLISAPGSTVSNKFLADGGGVDASAPRNSQLSLL